VPPGNIGSIPLTPPKVLLVRHGATEWSKNGRHTGRTDLPLLPEGETEARSLRTKLPAIVDGEAPSLVLSSPLKRALDTCRLAGYGDRVQIEPDLLEWDYGDYEGRTTPDIQHERPGWELFRDGCPAGESPEEVAVRVGHLVERLRSDEALDGPVLLFAHGHVLRMMAVVWAGLQNEAGRALPFDTAGVGVLGWASVFPALWHWNV
jgi:broad specificity phosphatase PhoE